MCGLCREPLSLTLADASGAIEWNKPKFVAASAARRRGVKIDEGHIALAFYHGEEVARPFRLRLSATPAPEGWIVFGSLGLSLAHDPRNGFTLSVEGASLLHLLVGKGGGRTVPASWATLAWHDGNCLCAAHGDWRGVVAEYRLWVSLFHYLAPCNVPRPSVEAHLGMIRGWYPREVLRELVTCVGETRVLELLAIVASCDYAGAPDLMLFTVGAVEMTEVKSSSDSLRPEQAQGVALRV